MASQVLVRPAVPTDAQAILAIFNEAILTTTATYDYEPQSLESRLAWLEDHWKRDLPVLVAEVEGAVVGWASLNLHRDKPGYARTLEDSVYVGSAARGMGVGTALLRDLVAVARCRGIHVVIAGIDAENEASLRLHRRAGFTDAGRFREVGWKFGRWLDVIYLQITLD